MRAWWIEQPGPINDGPLRWGARPEPLPGPGQVRVRIRCCGVCSGIIGYRALRVSRLPRPSTVVGRSLLRASTSVTFLP
jgi:NADPH:quinone reductase-like Zn-dependent oxidoreductase